MEFTNGVNILHGRNAQGKTNLIEAVYFCATARSHRTSSHRELIRFGADSALLRAQIAGGNGGCYNRIDVILRQSGKITKGAAVNGLPIDKLGDLLGILYCVIFSPEDLNLIKAGPGERRRFMDMELCQVSKVYYYELKQYYKVLKQRNSLLKSLQKGGRGAAGELAGTLELWDEQLVSGGMKIMAYRKAYIEKINVIAAQIHKRICGCGEELSSVYRPSVEGDFGEKLKKSRDRDIYNGSTGYGIHKDDVMFMINGLDSRVYGSQGQQRTAALSLKLAEVEVIRGDKGESPLLLLDDVMSELDKTRQECLIGAIGGLQTIITCTGVEDVLYGSVKKDPDAAFFDVENGVITRIK